MLLDGGSLARQAVHEVYADIVYSCLTADPYCIYSLTGVVTTTQEVKQVIIEGLHSHAYAVHAQRAQGSDVIRSNVIRIALYGEFLKIVQAEQGIYGRYYAAQLFRGQAGGGSPSEIEGIDGGAFKVILAQMQFTAYGADITCGFFLTHGGEEAAVYTAFGTKRDMYVYARQTVRSLS